MGLLLHTLLMLKVPLVEMHSICLNNEHCSWAIQSTTKCPLLGFPLQITGCLQTRGSLGGSCWVIITQKKFKIQYTASTWCVLLSWHWNIFLKSHKSNHFTLGISYIHIFYQLHWGALIMALFVKTQHQRPIMRWRVRRGEEEEGRRLEGGRMKDKKDKKRRGKKGVGGSNGNRPTKTSFAT